MSSIVAQTFSTAVPVDGPLVEKREPERANCISEVVKIQGDPQYVWQPNRGPDGIEFQTLWQVTAQRQAVVPIECERQETKLITGIDTHRKVDNLGNVSIVNVPRTSTVSSVTAVGRGTPIMIGPSQGYVMQNGKVETTAMSSAVQSTSQNNSGFLYPNNIIVRQGGVPPPPSSSPSSTKTAGSDAKEKAGGAAPVVTAPGAAPQKGGDANTNMMQAPPSSLTREEIEQAVSGMPPQGFVVDPRLYAANLTLPPNQIAFARWDPLGYGVPPDALRSEGLPFDNEYTGIWNYDPMNLALLGSLRDISYRLNTVRPDIHTYLFGPQKDTIATMESQILATIGRLEAMKIPLDREMIFGGLEQLGKKISAARAKNPKLRPVHLSRYIGHYVQQAKVPVLYSPLSCRHLDLSPNDVQMKQIRPFEYLAVDCVRNLLNIVSSLDKVPMANAVPNSTAGPAYSYASAGVEPALRIASSALRSMETNNVWNPAVFEDALLSALAVMQDLEARVLNFKVLQYTPYPEVAGIPQVAQAAGKTFDQIFVIPEVASYLMPILVLYATQFRFESSDMVITLPLLRQKQVIRILKERNVALHPQNILPGYQKMTPLGTGAHLLPLPKLPPAIVHDAWTLQNKGNAINSRAPPQVPGDSEMTVFYPRLLNHPQQITVKEETAKKASKKASSKKASTKKASVKKA